MGGIAKFLPDGNYLGFCLLLYLGVFFFFENVPGGSIIFPNPKFSLTHNIFFQL